MWTSDCVAAVCITDGDVTQFHRTCLKMILWLLSWCYQLMCEVLLLSLKLGIFVVAMSLFWNWMWFEIQTEDTLCLWSKVLWLSFILTRRMIQIHKIDLTFILTSCWIEYSAHNPSRKCLIMSQIKKRWGPKTLIQAEFDFYPKESPPAAHWRECRFKAYFFFQT